jgi:hypothetical protein
MTDHPTATCRGPARTDLDGHTIEELAEYLDRGRIPMDPAIEVSSSCRLALAALERLHALTAQAVAADAPSADDSWVASVMSRIALDARAGADLIVARTADGDEIVMTEGALRALIRTAGDEVQGVLVGRIRFIGDLDAVDSDLAVAVDVVVVHGTLLPATMRRLRAAIHERLRTHTPFVEPRIDVTVCDLLQEVGA